MPVEIRFIKFTLNEVIDALRELSHKGQFDLPKSSPRDLRERTDSQGRVIEFLFNGAEAPIKIANSFVAASLIRYCKRFQIPIPKNEEKSIAVIEGAVILKIGSDRGKNFSATPAKKMGKEINTDQESDENNAEEFLL